LALLPELENTAPRIKSDFKPEHADLIDAQKRKRLRKERRIKRIVTVIVGYAVMAWMVYLIVVTARTVVKAYDPYDILGVARVSCPVRRKLHAQEHQLTGIFKIERR